MPINPILVVGGAGYIGSHMLLALRAAGYQPIVLDNLSTGHRDAVLDAELIVGDMSDRHLLEQLFSRYPFAAVMHFAAFIDVAESVQYPARYYQNNVIATLTLLQVMMQFAVKKIIYSSTAAVYGEPQTKLINESHPLAPINPYGCSKKMVEDTLQDFSRHDGLQYAILRYFNAAGADPEGRVTERHEPEYHLIPLVLQVAAGLREHIEVYGNQYPTVDGTCVRDYVHVSDICQAHLLALQLLLTDKPNILCNLGSSQGHSVLQVINAARQVTGHPIPIVASRSRPGDPAILVADSTLAKQQLNWAPQFNDLNTIIQHAWQAQNKSHYSAITA